MNEAEIRMRLVSLENKVDYLFRELGLAEKYQTDWAQQTAQTGMADVIALLRINQKIKAIKLYRDKTGAGLREAKNAVENMEDFM